MADPISRKDSDRCLKKNLTKYQFGNKQMFKT